MMKGLVRDFVSFQKEKVFINLKKKNPNKDFVVMQMRHTRLGRFLLPEQVFMVIFCILPVIVTVCRTLDLLCTMNSSQAQLCPAA